MPDGEPTALTPASGATTGNGETTFGAFPIEPALLVAGTNVLAIEVHETTPVDGDLVFDCVLDALVGEPLLPQGSAWRRFDAGMLPADDWASMGFDDSAWVEGPAPLGTGDADVSTPISGGGPSYFRASFDAVDPDALEVLLLRVVRDDGAVVYLNGEEILRSNMPLGDVFAETLASSEVVEGEERRWQETVVDPGLLVPGENTIAVELHAASAADSDLRFDLEVLGR